MDVQRIRLRVGAHKFKIFSNKFTNNNKLILSNYLFIKMNQKGDLNS
jgi:hypothetical protein